MRTLNFLAVLTGRTRESSLWRRRRRCRYWKKDQRFCEVEESLDSSVKVTRTEFTCTGVELRKEIQAGALD